jgi:hypothetical protein
VSNWVKRTSKTFGRGLIIRVIDPQSLVGMWNAVRHGIRRYPTLIINGQEKFTGWEAADSARERLNELLSST